MHFTTSNVLLTNFLHIQKGNLRSFDVNYYVSRITSYLCYFLVKNLHLCYVFTLFHL